MLKPPKSLRNGDTDMGKVRHFILCPHCKNKSKLLRSEMGGYQYRVCAIGHHFTYDKVVANYSLWNPMANPYYGNNLK